MSSPRELVELYAMLGRRVLAQTSTDGALGAVTSVAVDAIPGVAYASITRRRDNGFQTLGATHPDATTNDRTQYDVASGPCVDATLGGATVILVPDLRHDPRYPVFGPAAARTGVASMLSTQLVFDDADLHASLNLYAKVPDAFDDTAQTIALVMATHGALAVASVAARELAGSLQRALVNSRNIGMAMGILMSRSCSPRTTPSRCCASPARTATASCTTSPPTSSRPARWTCRCRPGTAWAEPGTGP